MLIAQPKPSKPVAEGNGNQPLATAASERQAIGYEHEKLGIDPHVFETASLAYLGLALDGSNQTILVTGGTFLLQHHFVESLLLCDA